jgi:CRP-like cAMP-binding protein
MAEVRKMRRCEDPAHIQSVTDQSLRLYNGGTSIEAISKIVHTSCDRISRILRGSGVKVNRINKIPHRVYVDDDISEAYMMRIQGKTFQEIADWLGCSTSTASRLYQEECIRRRNEGI